MRNAAIAITDSIFRDQRVTCGKMRLMGNQFAGSLVDPVAVNGEGAYSDEVPVIR